MHPGGECYLQKNGENSHVYAGLGEDDEHQQAQDLQPAGSLHTELDLGG